MKKIQFSNHIFEKQTINFDNNLAIIIGESGSGKTEILNTLEQGLKGKLHEFYVDEQQVDDDIYQIIYLREYFNIKESLKLGKTSPLRNSLVQNINRNIINTDNEKYQNIITKLEEIHDNFNSLLKETTFETLNKSQINNSLLLNGNLEPFSINNIIDKLLKLQIFNNDTKNIIDEDNYSHFMLRILLFNILKNTLDFNDKLRPTIILFDLPELYGTPKILHELNVWLNKLLSDSITIIIVSNNPEYLLSLKPSLISINLIKHNTINGIKNLTKIIKDAIVLFSFCESKQGVSS
ncbi:ATP-binding protein [Spiroplasma sp. AdecLV25b]|uniref:ATP-binding protein n=1 Tax=Spiroplasma sp. AdecLV25b TaxID=3027162 RepID=UPI0027E0C19F|nr:ATP-binding protein [Spiroplasma sp. AdecLV25b]